MLSTRTSRSTAFFLLMLVMAACNDQPGNNAVNNNGNNTGKQLITDTLRFLNYGAPPDLGRLNAKNVVAKKWGIEFRWASDHAVSQETIDSAEKHNSKMDSLAALKFGANWLDRFSREVAAEYRTEQKVKNILIRLNYIAEKNAHLEKEGNALHFDMTPTPDTAVYHVSVSGWDIKQGKQEWLSFYRLTVNHVTGEVHLISDKAIKE